MMTIKDQVQKTVDDLRQIPFGEFLKTPSLDCSEGTIKAYLSDFANSDERFLSMPNSDGSYTIHREHKKVYAGHIGKSELQDELFKLKHGEIFSCHKKELAMSMKRANAIVVNASNTGKETPMYIKGVIGDELFVVCLQPSNIREKQVPKPRPPKGPPPPVSPPRPPKPRPAYIQHAGRAQWQPKPESPARWLQRQICYLFLDELEKKLVFKADTTKQRSIFKKLAKTAEIDPNKYGGLDFSVAYDYGKDSLVIRRKSRRKGLWHRGDLVARAAQRPEKGFSQYFDEPQLPSEMLYAIRRHRGVMDHAQGLWFRIFDVDAGSRVTIEHTHGAPKTETSGSRLERDVWEAVHAMELQPEIQRFPVWWAACDVERLLESYGFPNLQVQDVLTPEGEQDFSIITR